MNTAERQRDGSINEQSVWRYVKECNTADPSRVCRTAVIDCTREYTYGQMLTEWEHYARVFSALGITHENKSRVGIAGSISAEPLFCFYGLNMTGVTVSMLSYPDFLPSGQWKTMTKTEKLTDLIISDILITPELWPEIQKAKEELGLRNIILLHSLLGGPCSGPAELIYNEFNYHALQKLEGTVFMQDLLQKYGSARIVYGPNDADHIAVITHTSGTTKGTRKPLPYTDRVFNTTATNFGKGFHKDSGQFHVAPSFDFSSFLSICGAVNSYLCNGDTVVLTFFGFLHPKFVRAIEYYKLNIMFSSGFMIESWMKRKDLEHADFSSLAVFSCGGSYLSVEKLRAYKAFLHAHGYNGGIFRGYGMSETGGAELFVPPDCEDDILGFPRIKDQFLVKDEEDGNYYTADDGVRNGILYITSDTMCENTLDGEVLFELTEINGRKFICTNDLVHVNENGSFSYAGRANRYFVNNEGIRFEAGFVETALSRQPGIGQCAVVPVLDKRIHDTVPVLYVVPDNPVNAEETVRNALVQIYITDHLIERSALPSQFIVVENIPVNSNGKADIYRITRERLSGSAWNIIPVHENGVLNDIAIEPDDHPDSITGGTLPEGMEGRSALGLFEVFNS